MQFLLNNLMELHESYRKSLIKGSKGKKVLLQDMQIFFKFLKLIFDRICIHPPKKRLGSAGVCPFHLVASFKFGNLKSNVKSVERRGIKITKREKRYFYKICRFFLNF
jgi:hypothetical protein